MENTALFEAFKEFANKKKLSLKHPNGNGCYATDDIGVRVMYYQNGVEELEIVGNDHSYILKREKDGSYGLYTPVVFQDNNDNNSNDYKMYTFYPNKPNNKSTLIQMISDYYSVCRGEIRKKREEKVEKIPSLESCMEII